MPNSNYFDVIFATAGDLTVVPDAVQPSGSISYTDGWGPYYSQDPTVDPSTALLIDRAQTNQLFNDLTTALQFMQQNGCFNFITTAMNNGTPYSYGLGALCVYDDSDGNGPQIWLSTAKANTTTPGAGNWAALGTINATGLTSVSSSVGTNALTVGYAGGSLSFRSATLTSGAPMAAISGPLSLVVPSGATLGTVSGVAAELALLVAYNGGTPVLCIVNTSSGINLDETTLISPTTISGSSNSASTIYSAASVSANSPYRVIGYINITESVAGTWATAASLVQGAGGQALASLQSLGFCQTWQNVTGSRAASTTYYNTTSRPISISVYTTDAAQNNISLAVGGVTIDSTAWNAGSGTGTSSVRGIVPTGQSYSVTCTSTIGQWNELR